MQEVVSTVTLAGLQETIDRCKLLIGHETFVIDMARKVGARYISINIKKINEYIDTINYCESVKQAIKKPYE